MNYVCGYFFLRFKDGHEFRQINPSQSFMNLQYTVILSAQQINYIKNRNYTYQYLLTLIGASRPDGIPYGFADFFFFFFLPPPCSVPICCEENNGLG